MSRCSFQRPPDENHMQRLRPSFAWIVLMVALPVTSLAQGTVTAYGSGCGGGAAPSIAFLASRSRARQSRSP